MTLQATLAATVAQARAVEAAQASAVNAAADQLAEVGASLPAALARLRAEAAALKVHFIGSERQARDIVADLAGFLTGHLEEIGQEDARSQIPTLGCVALPTDDHDQVLPIPPAIAEAPAAGNTPCLGRGNTVPQTDGIPQLPAPSAEDRGTAEQGKGITQSDTLQSSKGMVLNTSPSNAQLRESPQLATPSAEIHADPADQVEAEQLVAVAALAAGSPPPAPPLHPAGDSAPATVVKMTPVGSGGPAVVVISTTTEAGSPPANGPSTPQEPAPARVVISTTREAGDPAVATENVATEAGSPPAPEARPAKSRSRRRAPR